ncbi:hypothetical protein [Aquirhabdus parva]|uniref:DUF1795 domain-containing protein n=1 Tax=Aquirhabdus parva TaxID=2283318 RepID=A0A345P8D8_9GAMM|nr:hypothetical protein [Aquirhabdus parva]AXI03547.1 hypothetical protein HYN46_12300 [Aquirhabdus parva]
MKTWKVAAGLLVAASLLSGCKSYEDQAVTISQISSPKASSDDWRSVSATKHAERFESPLGTIEFSQTPSLLKSIEQPKTAAAFSILRKQVERDFKASKCSLMSATDPDQLTINNHDFLHTTYRTRDVQNQRQRVEIYAAPINNMLVTIIVRIGDDADIYSYSDLQSFLAERVRAISKA